MVTCRCWVTTYVSEAGPRRLTLVDSVSTDCVRDDAWLLSWSVRIGVPILMILGGPCGSRGRRVMLYLTLLTPILALPAVMLMDRVERWAAGDTSRPLRPARTAPIAD